MIKKSLNLFLSAMFIITMACETKTKTTQEDENKADLTVNHKTKEMNSFVSIFEIPATDISRAITFYQSILDIEIEKMEFQGMEMGIFPYENQIITGLIIKAEDYEPSSKGTIIYLNGGDDLQVVLDKVVENGGQVIVPKTQHADENGYFALFLDTEGNKLGLNSIN